MNVLTLRLALVYERPDCSGLVYECSVISDAAFR